MQQAAARMYAQTAQKTVSPRELEATLLSKAAAKLENLIIHKIEDREAWNEALLYNRQLWVVLSSSLSRDDNTMPRDIKQNLLSLSVFIFKQSVTAGTNRTEDSIRSLISINRELAAGLRGSAT